jgi:hypothetical protein
VRGADVEGAAGLAEAELAAAVLGGAVLAAVVPGTAVLGAAADVTGGAPLDVAVQAVPRRSTAAQAPATR